MEQDPHNPASGLRPDENADPEGHAEPYADFIAYRNSQRDAIAHAYLISDPNRLADAYSHADLDTDRVSDAPSVYRRMRRWWDDSR